MNSHRMALMVRSCLLVALAALAVPAQQLARIEALFLRAQYVDQGRYRYVITAEQGGSMTKGVLKATSSDVGVQTADIMTARIGLTVGTYPEESEQIRFWESFLQRIEAQPGVDAATVTFRQEVTDPLSPVRTRDLKKSLYVTEEARQ